MAYSVSAVGDSQFPRFVIADDDGRFYSEQSRGGFNGDQGQATLFASQAKAHEMIRQLREMEFLDRPIREFKAKVKVRVGGNPDFGKVDLKEFLKRAVVVGVDGDGPVPDSFATVTFDWDSLKSGKQWLTD